MHIAKGATFIDVPKQVNSASGFFAMKFCSTYDGDELVDDVGDVELCFCPCSCLIILPFFLCVFADTLLVWF